MELCWLTTGRCNENCKYCDRFHCENDLSSQNYLSIMDRLIEYKIKQLTFGGGESLLVSCFYEIVKRASEASIYLKLVTNGILIPKYVEIIKYFDEITLSLDTLNDFTNDKLGRGKSHFTNVCKAIETITSVDENIKLNINTVATKVNIDEVYEMVDFIVQWNVDQWRIFRFSPLRGTAVYNKDLYDITSAQFEDLRKQIKSVELQCNVQFRDHIDMEKGYLLINPYGQLCVSRNMKDEIVGDMLQDNLKEWFYR